MNEAEALAEAEESARERGGNLQPCSVLRPTRSQGGSLSLEEAEEKLESDHDRAFTIDEKYLTELENLHKE